VLQLARTKIAGERQHVALQLSRETSNSSTITSQTSANDLLISSSS
jgi:hypothetical protein